MYTVSEKETTGLSKNLGYTEYYFRWPDGIIVHVVAQDYEEAKKLAMFKLQNAKDDLKVQGRVE